MSLTIILLHSGRCGPLTAFVKKISAKTIQNLTELYSPELFVLDTASRSHMNNAELFIWYIDVVIREWLRQKRQSLRTAGRHNDATKTAILLIDPASCHTAHSNGEKERREQLCSEINLEIHEAPAGNFKITITTLCIKIEHVQSMRLLSRANTVKVAEIAVGSHMTTPETGFSAAGQPCDQIHSALHAKAITVGG